MKEIRKILVNITAAAVLTINGAYGQVPAPTNSTGSEDLTRNWTLSKSFDAGGNVIAEGKQFFDDNGRAIQSQFKVKYRKDATTVHTHVFASQAIRDAYGRDALTTLAAPIDNSAFKYTDNFIRNPSGTAYNFANFDLYKNGSTDTDKTNNPDAMGSKTTKGTLGWYYSTNNTWEPYTPTTDYPFSRQTFYSDGTGNAKKSSAPGELYKMGGGHETISFVTPVLNELNEYCSIRNKYFPTAVSGAVPATLAGEAIQITGRDANGKEAIVIQDKGGRTLMVARPGNELSVGNVLSVGGTSNPDKTIHYFTLFAASTITLTGSGSYTLYNMDTEQSIAGTSLPAGYFKLVNTGTTDKGLGYTNGYADISYSFYNQLGQLIATIAPEGVKKLHGTGINNYATKTDVPFITLYEYDTRGRLTATQSAETGRTEYVYRMDGRIRFSRNAEQQTAGKYSYTNYDSFGRPIESGEYQPDGSGIAFNSNLAAPTNPMRDILENVSATGGLTSGTKTDVSITIYDVADASHGLSGYTQDVFTIRGAVSLTKKYSSIVNNTPSPANLLSATWFSYDDEGKLLWSIQYITGLGYKTTDFVYDLNGLLTERIFQKNVSAEYFAHKYEYDPANLSLWKVHTRKGSSDTWKLQATYTYYLHGPLKRIELDTDLQGIDYTYTLHGALKAINNSDKTKDPGLDGSTGSHASFKQDAFGMVLDYHANDYLNARSGIQAIKGVNTGSLTTDYFNGQIRAVSWFSKKPSAPAGLSDAPLTYVYQYDDKYQLTEATWGTSLNFSNTPATFTTTTYNKEKIKHPSTGAPGYDANGNITYLERTGKTGTLTEKFQYNYTANTNRLASITNTASGTQTYASYTYNLLGQLTYENPLNAAQKKYIKYDVTGRVVMVSRNAAFTQPVVEYVYNELGQRIVKKLYNGSYSEIQRTYYAGDVVYTQPVTGGVGGAITVEEYEIDGGSGRIGIYYRPGDIYAYQLTDHLGNTRAVVARSGSNMEVRMYSDYYPYGLVINEGANNYRYGYQGQYAEKDSETDWNAFELRMYDAKIGRWLSIDPKNQFHSPYVGMGNNPISGVDPDGGEVKSTIINEKGEVVGGKLDRDLGIYMVEGLTRENFDASKISDYKANGVVIGRSLFETSFYIGESGGWAGRIDIGSFAARDWLGRNIYTNTPSNREYISEYRRNGDNNRFNYKDIGKPGGLVPSEELKYRYRGSQISPGVYVSARDVGNIAAGYIAGMDGFGWHESRFAFELKEKLQHGSIFSSAKEAIQTVIAEKYGWEMGYKRYYNERVLPKMGKTYWGQYPAYNFY